jgi:hypothetical protein
MASIISAGTTDATSLNVSSDKTGILQLASNNAVTAVTIDASQNVGIGVTPAAFADKVVQVGSTGALAGSASYGSILSNNIYWSVAGFSTAKYITTGYGSYYYQDQTGKHTWASIPSGTAGTSATATNGMTLDNNNVLYLPNAPTGDAHVKIQQGAVTTLGAIGSSGLLILGGGSNNNLCQIGLGYTGSYSPTAISSITTTQSGYTIADLIFATRSVNTDTAPTERMRIDSSGNLLVGTTSANIGFTTGAKSLCFNSDYGGSYPVAINHSASGNGYFLGFGRGGSQCGYIWTNASNSTQYVTSSDYRLKENIVPMTGALAKVSALKPVTYTWKEDGTSSQGFIAHELQEIVPEAVAGDKDALNEDGSIKPQGIDTSFLVATLTAAIQELKAINDTQAETINALTARIEALENK